MPEAVRAVSTYTPEATDAFRVDVAAARATVRPARSVSVSSSAQKGMVITPSDMYGRKARPALSTLISSTPP